MSGTHETRARGPYFDELAVGQVFDEAPGLTLTSGQAAVHQAIVGDRLRLALDESLARRVTGDDRPLAHPGLVWDVAIGQSTLATHHVKANLFYRGLVLCRFPCLGDTLHTTTEVVGLRQNRRRPDRRPTGLAALRIRTNDQEQRPVLDFWRCAMLPLRDPDAETGHADDLSRLGSGTGRRDGTGTDTATWSEGVRGWRLDRFRDLVPGEHFERIAASRGRTWIVEGGDVVSSAPELARLTLNIASVHHDERAGGGRRLVYGGHTIGVAFAQLLRALPGIVTVTAWHGCDHLAPVTEGDRLTSQVTVEDTAELPGGGGLVHLSVRVTGHTGDDARDVLLWRCVAVMA